MTELKQDELASAGWAKDGGRLIAVCLLAGLMVGVVLFVRAWATGSQDRRICAKVDRLDNAILRIVGRASLPLRPGQYGYDYWRRHPNEKIGRPGTKQTRGQVTDALADLRRAACDTRNIRALP